MRAHGCIHSGSDLGTDGHACWAFDQDEEFAGAALEFLTDGLRADQRIAYIGGGSEDEQRERLAPLGDVGGLIDKGALQLIQLEDLYSVGEPVDTDARLAAYGAATDAALADGYSGLRVAAQATDLVADPRAWEAHIQWEGIADRFMSVRPLSALCGYRRDALPERLLSDLAAVHPAANDVGPVPFHLFSESGRVVLAGEVDCFSADDLDRLLELTCRSGERVSIELDRLGFIDHHGLETLAGHTRRLAANGGCEVRNAPPVVDRLCDLLELEL